MSTCEKKICQLSESISWKKYIALRIDRMSRVRYVSWKNLPRHICWLDTVNELFIQSQYMTSWLTWLLDLRFIRIFLKPIGETRDGRPTSRAICSLVGHPGGSTTAPPPVQFSKISHWYISTITLIGSARECFQNQPNAITFNVEPRTRRQFSLYTRSIRSISSETTSAIAICQTYTIRVSISESSAFPRV